MSKKPEFDLVVAHKFFSADCFNKTWGLIDKTDRTAEEDEEMIRLSLASTWHWIQREDCTDKNLSIGYWQSSRVYALLGQADNVFRYGQMCLEASQGEEIPPFYLGYAYEALAWAEAVAGKKKERDEYLSKAKKVAEKIPKEDEKKMLVDDLATIK